MVFKKLLVDSYPENAPTGDPVIALVPPGVDVTSAISGIPQKDNLPDPVVQTQTKEDEAIHNITVNENVTFDENAEVEEQSVGDPVKSLPVILQQVQQIIYCH